MLVNAVAEDTAGYAMPLQYGHHGRQTGSPSPGQNDDGVGASALPLSLPALLCRCRRAVPSFPDVSPYAELGSARVEVSPGGEVTTTLSVRNDTDIVEAYEFEVMGECASWTTVEPSRLPLYPGTQETVTVVLRPPLSPDVVAGEVPLAIRVVPVERPDLVAVPEMTVVIAPFYRLRTSLSPQRRRGWRSGRFYVGLHNQGNTRIVVPLVATDPAEQLALEFSAAAPELEPGEEAEVDLRARASRLIWFGKPVSNPFQVTASIDSGADAEDLPLSEELPIPEEQDGELLQVPVLPRWLLVLLAVLLALLLLWFTLARPMLRSAAREAVAQEAKRLADEGKLVPPPKPPPPGQQEPPPPPPPAPPPPPEPGTLAAGGQHSRTIELNTGPGDTGVRSYTVPEGKVFFITDLVLANHQGDEGVLTIAGHDRTITTIALETFRNQDYHWVTPIVVPGDEKVTATVRCVRPGTPPSGPPAGRCAEVLNLSGVLLDAPR